MSLKEFEISKRPHIFEASIDERGGPLQEVKVEGSVLWQQQATRARELVAQFEDAIDGTDRDKQVRVQNGVRKLISDTFPIEDRREGINGSDVYKILIRLFKEAVPEKVPEDLLIVRAKNRVTIARTKQFSNTPTPDQITTLIESYGLASGVPLSTLDFAQREGISPKTAVVRNAAARIKLSSYQPLQICVLKKESQHL